MKLIRGWLVLAASSMVACSADSGGGVESSRSPSSPNGGENTGSSGTGVNATAGNGNTGNATNGTGGGNNLSNASGNTSTVAVTTGVVQGPPTDCGSKTISAGRVVPDIMIVLDRSSSMLPDEGALQGIDCRTAGTPLDLIDPFFWASLEFLDPAYWLTTGACVSAGVDCNNATWSNTVPCGGTESFAIDRWTPSVSAIKSLTAQLSEIASFGLVTFPGASGGLGDLTSCAAGSIQVPVGRDNAGAIAGALDQTQPLGATPTGPTLEALAQQFNNANFDPDRPPQPKYVLLVTDGEPTCPNTFGRGGRGGPSRDAPAQDRAVAVQAIDQLREAGVKTYVVGYDAQLNETFQAALNEFAQHGGTEFYRSVQDEQSLVTELRSIATEVVECSYNLDEVPSDPRFVKVVVDGQQVNLGDLDAGWTIDGTTVTIHGAACEGLQDGQTHLVNVTVECDIVPVR